MLAKTSGYSPVSQCFPIPLVINNPKAKDYHCGVVPLSVLDIFHRYLIFARFDFHVNPTICPYASEFSIMIENK